MIRWIENWFNPRRLDTNGFRSPAHKEADWCRQDRYVAPIAAEAPCPITEQVHVALGVTTVDKAEGGLVGRSGP